MFNSNNTPFSQNQGGNQERTEESASPFFFDNPFFNSLENLLERKIPESPAKIQTVVLDNLVSYHNPKKDFEAILSLNSQFPDLGPNYEWAPSIQLLSSKIDKNFSNYMFQIRKFQDYEEFEAEEEEYDDTIVERADVLQFLENEAENQQSPIPLNEQLKDRLFQAFEEKQRHLSEITLPSMFEISNTFFKSQHNALSRRREKSVEVSKAQDGCTCIGYLKRRNGSKSDASIQTLYPLHQSFDIGYFEVTVKKMDGRSVVAIGLAHPHYDIHAQPGWQQGSYGYHSDDGHKFSNSGRGKDFGPKYNVGDTVGCGRNFKTREIFFTKNGAMVGIAFQNVKNSEVLHPIVGLDGSEIVLNLGTKKFMFDIDSMIQKNKEIERNALKSQQNVERNTFRELVRDYLIHSGYSQTLKNFDNCFNKRISEQGKEEEKQSQKIENPKNNPEGEKEGKPQVYEDYLSRILQRKLQQKQKHSRDNDAGPEFLRFLGGSEDDAGRMDIDEENGNSGSVKLKKKSAKKEKFFVFGQELVDEEINPESKENLYFLAFRKEIQQRIDAKNAEECLNILKNLFLERNGKNEAKKLKINFFDCFPQAHQCLLALSFIQKWEKLEKDNEIDSNTKIQKLIEFAQSEFYPFKDLKKKRFFSCLFEKDPLLSSKKDKNEKDAKDKGDSSSTSQLKQQQRVQSTMMMGIEYKTQIALIPKKFKIFCELYSIILPIPSLEQILNNFVLKLNTNHGNPEKFTKCVLQIVNDCLIQFFGGKRFSKLETIYSQLGHVYKFWRTDAEPEASTTTSSDALNEGDEPASDGSDDDDE